MKKFVVAILSLLYITTTSGATIHLHYCMGKLAEWSFGHSQSDICSKCGMDKDDSNNSGCCKDEYKQIKLVQDQNAPNSAWQLINALPQTTPLLFFEITTDDLSSLTQKNHISHTLLRSFGVAVFIRNCVFLI